MLSLCEVGVEAALTGMPYVKIGERDRRSVPSDLRSLISDLKVLGAGLWLQDRTAAVETAAGACGVLKLRRTAVRALAERRLLELVMSAALVTARTGIPVCWIWHCRTSS